MAFYDNMAHMDEDGSCVSDGDEIIDGNEPSADQKCRQDLVACMKTVEDVKESCKRVAADFENFKKRVERDRIAWTQSAQAEILRDLLPVVDDFDRAILEYQKKEGEVKDGSWIAGFELIRKMFNKLLQTYGVTEIEQMTVFDPELHEALTQIESAAHKTGDIVEVLHKGYVFKGRVLRAARVTVAK